MHNAPPVAFPVGRFVWGRIAWLLMSLLSAMGLVAWAMQAQYSSTQLGMAWLFWATCAGGAAVLAPRQMIQSGRLFWNGQAWFWQQPAGEDISLQVSVGLDVGSGLLLFVRRMEGSNLGRKTWACAWLVETSMPPKWHGFRCAVYSRPKADAAAQGLDSGRP